MEKLFIFKVTPMGKPRMTRSDKWKKRDIVVRYNTQYKDVLKSEARKMSFKVPAEIESIEFSIAMPASWSMKKRQAMVGQPHQSTPDIDNLEKAFLDTLCEEDKYVWRIGNATKRWSVTGYISVIIDC